MYTATTRAMQVTVRPQYLPDESDPDKSQFVWSYQVRIENKGDIAVQLRSRHWKITDALGRQQDVKGPGVVPVLSETPGTIRSAGPARPGQHNNEIYHGLLGKTDEEIAALRAEGAL